MVAQFVAALERPVSRVRLGNYRTPAVVDDLDMVVNYFRPYGCPHLVRRRRRKYGAQSVPETGAVIGSDHP